VAALEDGAGLGGGVLILTAVVVTAGALVEAAAAAAAARLGLRPRPSPPVRRLVDDLAAGERVAVVGNSGSRRRTLADLLVALYHGEDGSKTEQAARIAVLLGEPVMLPQSVAANIALGRPGAAHAEIETAARAAGVHDLVRALPDGYHTTVGGSSVPLSHEARLRIALARAFLQDAPVLVLAAPYDGLGPPNGRGLPEVLEHLARGRRTLVIASTVEQARHADRILLLDGTRVVEQGRPSDVLAQRTGLVRVGGAA